METTEGEGKSVITLPELDDEGEEDEDTGEDNKKKRPLTPSKRRGSGAGGSTHRSCQVENCTADMNDAKPYHRRHKVCGFHAKAPVVPLGGLQQRFCQQCSRHFSPEPNLARREVHLIYERKKNRSVGFLFNIHVLAVMPCRFHEVSEFDEAKRSCRRRLAGHNERRRKSSYES